MADTRSSNVQFDTFLFWLCVKNKIFDVFVCHDTLHFASAGVFKYVSQSYLFVNFAFLCIIHFRRLLTCAQTFSQAITYTE